MAQVSVRPYAIPSTGLAAPRRVKLLSNHLRQFSRIGFASSNNSLRGGQVNRHRVITFLMPGQVAWKAQLGRSWAQK